MSDLRDYSDEFEPFHVFFGLSYASYLVIPRVVLQSMPAEWQRKMLALVHEAGATLGEWPERGHYKVTLVVGEPSRHHEDEDDDEESEVEIPDPLCDYRHRRLEPIQGEEKV